MKIIIVENPRPRTLEHYNDVANAPLSASLNCGYALAVARRSGWEASYLDLSSDTSNATDRAARILMENADLILLHWVYSWGHEQAVCDILDLLRLERSVPIGAFGLFPTLARQRLLQYAPHLDFILVGEFEETLADLLGGFKENTELTALPGIALRVGEFTGRPLIDDLTALPIPDDIGANCSYPSLNIAASRGCYGACSFCFINQIYGCSRRRVRSLNSLGQELEARLTRRTIDSLYFIDPSFIGEGLKERERVLEISRMAQELGLPFGFETRADSINAELLASLSKNGARSIFLGIESGCDAVLERIGKRITRQQVVKAVQAVQGSGIQLTVGFIMFEPDTTLDELAENYAFLDQVGLLTDHDLTANLLYHNQIVLYGSAAWERFEREGRLLIDPQRPFEARYRFRDERVGLVCSSMGRLTSEYFKLMDAIPGAELPVNRQEVNILLKEAFRAFCLAAKGPFSLKLSELEDNFHLQLTGIVS